MNGKRNSDLNSKKNCDTNLRDKMNADSRAHDVNKAMSSTAQTNESNKTFYNEHLWKNLV